MPRPYKLDLSPAARRDLKRLPLSIQKEIVFQHLPEISRDPFSKTKPLVGIFKRERSYHFGRKPEYRIIFYIEEDSITISIIGTREGIYKRVKRRKS